MSFHLKIGIACSVTRFGEISPLLQHFKSLKAILITFIQYLVNFRTKILCILANQNCYKRPNNLGIWSHGLANWKLVNDFLIDPMICV